MEEQIQATKKERDFQKVHMEAIENENSSHKTTYKVVEKELKKTVKERDQLVAEQKKWNLDKKCILEVRRLLSVEREFPEEPENEQEQEQLTQQVLDKITAMATRPDVHAEEPPAQKNSEREEQAESE